MTPLFVSSATVPAHGRVLSRGGRGGWMRLPVRWGFFRHPDAGLILIDTGYSRAVTADSGRSWALRTYQALFRARLRESGQIAPALARHGHAAADVKAVILTHLHADHVAGLADLPDVPVILGRAALESLSDKPSRALIRHGVFPELLPADLHQRARCIEDAPTAMASNELGIGHDLFGDGSVIAQPLPGHAAGHFGLLFTGLAQPLLYACDAQWVMAGLDQGRAPGWPLKGVCDDPAAWAESTAKVRAFAKTGDVVLCHDPAPSAWDEVD